MITIGVVWKTPSQTLATQSGPPEPQQQQHLGVYLKCRISVPAPDLIQKLHFNKIPEVTLQHIKV